MRDIADRARAEIMRVLLAPVADPAAPSGYVRALWAEAETRRRRAEALAILRRALAEIEQSYGPVIAGSAPATMSRR